MPGNAMAITSFAGKVPSVHPSAYVHPSAELSGEVVVHPHASVWPMVVLRGDVGAITIGEGSNIQDGSIAHATGGVSTTTVGFECTVGHRVTLHGCTVGDHCLVGMSSTLLDNVVLGEWCFVAAGTLIPPGKVFPPRSFILGTPGKRIREVTREELDAIVHGAAVYRRLAAGHRG